MLNFLQARKSYLYLVYTHFYDERETTDESCQGNHYHVLISRNFESKAGTIIKASQTYIYEWLQKLMKQQGRPKASCRSVKSIAGYLDYLKNYPRSLVVYSAEFIQLAEEGYFHTRPFDHTESVID